MYLVIKILYPLLLGGDLCCSYGVAYGLGEVSIKAVEASSVLIVKNFYALFAV
jgi:hypothetical protein